MSHLLGAAVGTLLLSAGVALAVTADAYASAGPIVAGRVLAATGLALVLVVVGDGVACVVQGGRRAWKRC